MLWLSCFQWNETTVQGSIGWDSTAVITHTFYTNYMPTQFSSLDLKGTVMRILACWGYYSLIVLEWVSVYAECTLVNLKGCRHWKRLILRNQKRLPPNPPTQVLKDNFGHVYSLRAAMHTHLPQSFTYYSSNQNNRELPTQFCLKYFLHELSLFKRNFQLLALSVFQYFLQLPAPLKNGIMAHLLLIGGFNLV